VSEQTKRSYGLPLRISLVDSALVPRVANGPPQPSTRHNFTSNHPALNNDASSRLDVRKRESLTSSSFERRHASRKGPRRVDVRYCSSTRCRSLLTSGTCRRNFRAKRDGASVCAEALLVRDSGLRTSATQEWRRVKGASVAAYATIAMNIENRRSIRISMRFTYEATPRP
jgi:hypothetical protein